MTDTSVMCGMRRNVTVPLARNEAAMIGNAAFFAPCVATEPSRRDAAANPQGGLQPVQHLKRHYRPSGSMNRPGARRAMVVFGFGAELCFDMRGAKSERSA